MEVSRRSFMTGLAVLVGGIVVGDNPIKLITDFNIPDQVQTIPGIRIMSQYDIESDTYLVRYDLYDAVNNKQFYCASTITDTLTVDRYINTVHKPTEIQLKNFMLGNRINISNLRKLDLPVDYKHPAILMRILEHIRYT